MIHLNDAYILARTKLKTRRIRTGVTVVIISLLFTAIITILLVSKGIELSVQRFSKDGIASKYFVMATKFDQIDDSYVPPDAIENQDFIKAVKKEYERLVAKKKAAAKRYTIAYDQATEDPGLVRYDKSLKRDTLPYELSSDPLVVDTYKKWKKEKPAFDMKRIAEPYHPKQFIDASYAVQPTQGSTLKPMKDGKESFEPSRNQPQIMPGSIEEYPPQVAVFPSEITKYFQTATFTPEKNVLPAIIPFNYAEKYLSLKPLSRNATTREKLQRLRYVKSHIQEVSIPLCYRNTTSQELIGQAVETQKQLELNKGRAGYEKPSVIYDLPTPTSCGAAGKVADTRLAAEKDYQDRLTKFNKEFGRYTDPEQFKLTLQGVGISPSINLSAIDSVAGTAAMLFRSELSFNFAVPEDLVAKSDIPKTAQTIFKRDNQLQHRQMIYEFTNEADARAFMAKNSCGAFGCGAQNIQSEAYGSASLAFANMADVVKKVLFWVIIGVGTLAAIILLGLIGRIIADGRRESAVFRAIGARRADIAAIYYTYTLLLARNIILLSFMSALIIALIINRIYMEDVTSQVQLTTNTTDASLKFWLIGFDNGPLALIALMIVGACLLAASIPLLRHMTRSPIKDMRDDS